MQKLTRTRDKPLGLGELIAIALGGMVGGGIFAILGISVQLVGRATPIAILMGGTLAFFAAYSYVKLALLYKDEGATYSFFKKTFRHIPFASAAIGWLVLFGYISTLALYAFTFSSYFCSMFATMNSHILQKTVAGGILAIFMTINLVSVKGMGKVEDWLVYTKIILILFISGLLAGKGDASMLLPLFEEKATFSAILIVAAVTFVAYEGFQLVIHAYNEMTEPQKNIPRAIYSSIAIATLLYVGLAIGALAAIPQQTIVDGKEYALAAGAEQYLGKLGLFIVIAGALMATSSAISGTLFGASRLMAVVAADGFLPGILEKRHKGHIPGNAIVVMTVLAFSLILAGGLQLILEFGSITFIVVSFLMARANLKVSKLTHSSGVLAVVAMLGLFMAGVLIFRFEYKENREELMYILGIYALLIIGSFIFARRA